MEGSSDSHDSQGEDSFPFEKLPLELRRKIYILAAIREHPIKLRINYHGCAPGDTSVIGRTRLYAVEDFRALETNHEFRTEMIRPLYRENAFDLSLSMEEADEGTSLMQIDIRRVRRCRILIHDMQILDAPRMDVWCGTFPLVCHLLLRSLVATLVFEGHQIESMLVECERQTTEWLLVCLRPIAMLRHVGLIHFRSCSPEVHQYFRRLELLIMSDRPVPFSNPQEFRDRTQPWLFPSWPVFGEVIDKTEEEMEATAKALYEILGFEAEMKPQKDL